ncbi:hypothetical protein [Burkholderia territorii]|uniref:hypothetical protein n=1 Tax=Burkholderia territorii TaxID=1503055 RepID=UPI0012D94FE9|nr:hypothetical protein [Burkholderia territorii]
MFVQFSDQTEDAIVAIFSCKQDAAAYPNQGEVDISDPRYAAYYDSIPFNSRGGLPEPISSTS